MDADLIRRRRFNVDAHKMMVYGMKRNSRADSTQETDRSRRECTEDIHGVTTIMLQCLCVIWIVDCVE